MLESFPFNLHGSNHQRISNKMGWVSNSFVSFKTEIKNRKLLIISLIINIYYICMLQVERIESKFLGEISDEKNGILY